MQTIVFPANLTMIRAFTCLQHLLKADDGMLGGAICSRTPPVALKSGMTSIKTVTETSPKHKTSALLTLPQNFKKDISKTIEQQWGLRESNLSQMYFL